MNVKIVHVLDNACSMPSGRFDYFNNFTASNFTFVLIFVLILTRQNEIVRPLSVR
jgi:hypothetical protein